MMTIKQTSFAGLMLWLSPVVLFGAAAQAGPAACTAQSAATVPTVVELYTSEGCDSCPPADRWLSSLKASRPDVLAAAFHVDYWDRLGWKDRFASPAYTERQHQTLAHSGARFAYTPQIIVNGQDWRGASLRAASSVPALVSLRLERRAGDQVGVDLHALAGAPAKVQLWWAAVEDGHQSDVKAGENRGVTLKHDDVVRDYAVLPAASGDQHLTLRVKPMGEKPRRLVVVAVDPSNGRVLQAVELGC